MADWTTLYGDGLDVEYQHLIHQADTRAKKLGLDEVLWPFQYQDLLRASLKQNIIIAYQMGLGKTRFSLSLAPLHGSEHVMIIAPKRLFGEWISEVDELGLLKDFQIVEYMSDLAHLKKFNLVSLTDLWRIPKDSSHRQRLGQANYKMVERGDDEVKTLSLKYSLAWYLRKRFGTIILDEAYTMQDVSTNQGRAIHYLKSKHKILLTGTPVRGYPNNIVSLLNWAFGNGSDVWPDYSFFVDGAVQRFLDRFGTYIYFDEQHRRTASKGKKKLLPKIKDPEGFQNMLASKMIRRLNTEPEVMATVQIPEPHLHYEPIDMDERHRKAYEQVLRDFQIWYAEAEAEAAEQNREIRRNEILQKLTVLISCASFPQAKDDLWLLSGKGTSKQNRALELVEQYVQDGRKIMLLSRSVAHAKWAFDRIEEMGLSPVYIDGSVSLTWDRKKWTSKRIQRLKEFRTNDAHKVLVGTTPSLAEGLNIPEASVVIFVDYDWTPSVMTQAFSRTLRPQQKRDVHVHFLTCQGTIEEYQELLCLCKQQSIAEGLDYETYDFDLEDLPDIRAYADALVTNKDILSRLSRKRTLIQDEDSDE